jgi:hypothetical protein
MPVEMSIEGDGLKALQRKIKQLPNRAELVRELNKGLREGAKDMPDAARAAARSELPHAGGLAERIASAPMSISVGQGKVKIRVRGIDARNADRGRLRHPVYGNRGAWVTQVIKPGWFTDRMRREAPKVRPELVKAMDRIAAKIA